MKLQKCFLLIAVIFVVTALCAAASPDSPKLPSTLNFQSLNEIGVPSNETEWAFEMSRLDMAICSDHLSGLRSRSTSIYLLQYMLLHTVLTDDTVELSNLSSCASANGYDAESAFLHFYDDTVVTYADGSSETIKGYGGGTASTLKDARVKNHIWTSYRYIYNLHSPLFQKFKGQQFRSVITSGNKPDGIFIDEVSPAASYFPTIGSGGRVIEYDNKTPSQFASTFQSDTTTAFAAVNAAMGTDHPTYPGGDRLILPNVAEYVQMFADLGTNGADGILTEYWMQVCQPRVIEACDIAKQLAGKGKVLIFSQGTADPEISALSNYTSAKDRHQMFSLSNYWLAKQGIYTYYQQKAGSNSPSLSSFWCKAREFDIGTPVDALYSVWNTGTDSANQNFTIYRREYTKALVLSRPKIGWEYSDYATQSPHFDLGAAYRLLHADGTLGAEIGKIGLAMGEAVTLIKTDSAAPSDTTAPKISNVTSSNVGSVSATIAWTTDESASGTVEYGTTTSYGYSTSASSLATSHSIILLGLSGDTTYHYRVSAMDAAGNRSVSTDYTFTTQSSSGGEASSTGYIKHWAALGAFAYTNGTGHDTDYIGETTVHPSIGESTASKTWTDYASSADMLDLGAIFTPNTYAIAYLNVYIHSETQRNCQLRIGVDDAAKAFLNGVLVINDTGYKSSDPDTNKADVTLNAGWNQLLVKAENFTVGWTLYARFTDTSGNIIPQLTYRVDYPVTVIGGTPKLAVTISVDKTTAKVGEQLVYTVTYTNSGDGSATSTVIKADVDSHVNFVSATNGGVYDESINAVKWTIGTIGPGTSSSLNYTVTVK